MGNEEVEIRCPIGPRRLFAKLTLEGDTPTVSNGLMAMSCSDCTRAKRKQGLDVLRVLHKYNFIGELVESVDIYN